MVKVSATDPLQDTAEPIRGVCSNSAKTYVKKVRKHHTGRGEGKKITDGQQREHQNLRRRRRCSMAEKIFPCSSWRGPHWSRNPHCSLGRTTHWNS